LIQESGSLARWPAAVWPVALNPPQGKSSVVERPTTKLTDDEERVDDARLGVSALLVIRSIVLFGNRRFIAQESAGKLAAKW